MRDNSIIMGIISKNDQNYNIIRHERNICCCVKNNVINKKKGAVLDTINAKANQMATEMIKKEG